MFKVFPTISIHYDVCWLEKFVHKIKSIMENIAWQIENELETIQKTLIFLFSIIK